MITINDKYHVKAAQFAQLNLNHHCTRIAVDLLRGATVEERMQLIYEVAQLHYYIGAEHVH